MKKNTSYKEMLRNRCPKTVNYALKWQKSKDKWINHTYKSFIKFYSRKEDRYAATRIILGISKKFRNFDFHQTIDWDNLTREETNYWNRIESWVKWFCKYYILIEEEYNISKKCAKTDMDIKISIINKYLSSLMPLSDDTEDVKQAKYKYVDNLVNFLIKCIEGKM